MTDVNDRPGEEERRLSRRELLKKAGVGAAAVGVPTDLIRGDLYDWPGIMAAILIPSIPLALVYNAFLNRFIAGFTGGAFR